MRSGRKFAWRRAALAVGILTFAGGTWLPAQKTAKPVNVDGKVAAQRRERGRRSPARLLAELRTQPERDPLQHAEADQRHQCEAPRAGVVLRGGRGRRQSGRNAADVEQHALRHHHLERGLRARRPHRQRVVALGPGSEPDRRAAEDLLRHRESRRGALQRHDHRAD